jgi:hypothetical protein
MIKDLRSYYRVINVHNIIVGLLQHSLHNLAKQLFNISYSTIIIGPKGQKIVEGTQAALDITDILDENADIQTLHLILGDKDGGMIGTSPLYLVQKYIGIGNQHNILPEIPIPIMTKPLMP